MRNHAHVSGTMPIDKPNEIGQLANLHPALFIVEANPGVRLNQMLVDRGWTNAEVFRRFVPRRAGRNHPHDLALSWWQRQELL